MTRLKHQSKHALRQISRLIFLLFSVHFNRCFELFIRWNNGKHSNTKHRPKAWNDTQWHAVTTQCNAKNQKSNHDLSVEWKYEIGKKYWWMLCNKAEIFQRFTTFGIKNKIFLIKTYLIWVLFSHNKENKMDFMLKIIWTLYACTWKVWFMKITLSTKWQTNRQFDYSVVVVVVLFCSFVSYDSNLWKPVSIEDIMRHRSTNTHNSKWSKANQHKKCI